MRAKLFTAAGLIAVVAAVGVVATATGRATVDTKVTIRAPGGEVYGKVKSEKTKCKSERKVTVFQQKGGDQGGGDDIKRGTDFAEPNGPDYTWNIGNPGLTGKKIYAHVGKIPGCRGDNSKTIVAG